MKITKVNSAPPNSDLHYFVCRLAEANQTASDEHQQEKRRTIRLARVNHGLRRLVIIGSDGFITLEALRWLADQGAAFVMLDLRGKVLAVTGPVSPSDAKLRRAQALALGNGVALKISKELISQKLTGQATLVRDMLSDSRTSAIIERFRDELPNADAIESVRLIEAQAAKLLQRATFGVRKQPSLFSMMFVARSRQRSPSHCLPAHSARRASMRSRCGRNLQDFWNIRNLS